MKDFKLFQELTEGKKLSEIILVFDGTGLWVMSSLFMCLEHR